MKLQHKIECPRGSLKPSFENQHFLLNFIMGTYLGPDIKSDNPQYSAFQRLAEGSSSYLSNDLGPSYVSMSLLENLYYYVLRNAHPSLRLGQNILHEYLKGSLSLPSNSWQFTSFFALNLHKQIWYPTSFRIIKGIVFIDDPVISHIQEDDVEKFKSLSGIDSFKINLDELLHQEHEYQDSKDIEQDCMTNDEETEAGHISNGNGNSSVRFIKKFKRTRQCDPLPMPTFPHVVAMSKHSSEREFPRTYKWNGPAIMPLLSIPSMEECISDASTILSGTARKAVVGPPVGVVDVGVSKVAYYFRVSLPGVIKDYPGKFSCEIESDGKVQIQGLTSGGKIIKKPSRVFEMKFQQLCPPGPFTLSFSLPGPVDPRLFAPNFRSDGIFEGVIIKT